MHNSLVIDSVGPALVTFARRSHSMVGRSDVIAAAKRVAAAVCALTKGRTTKSGRVERASCPKFS